MQRFSLRFPPETSAEPKPRGSAPQVLLIEDNPADSGLVREALVQHQVDCEVVLITNGERAIEFIRGIETEGAPCADLVILDLNLPRKTGWEVLETVRASTYCRQAPVVILTSSDNQKDRIDAARLGASRYIRKPSRLAEFLMLGDTFKSILDQR